MAIDTGSKLYLLWTQRSADDADFEARMLTILQVSDPAAQTDGKVLTTESGSYAWKSAAAVVLPNSSVAINTTLGSGHHTVRVDSTSASVTITLPSAASCQGRIYRIFKMVAGNSVIIDGNGAELVDGAATVTITNAKGIRTIQSNGVSWDLLSSIT